MEDISLDRHVFHIENPTIGRILHYILTEKDAEEINRQRTSSSSIRERIQNEKWPIGAQAHIGNSVGAGVHVPMIVVCVWPTEFGPDNCGVNGQCFLDGNDTFWVTSAAEGTEPGTWHWPERE